ncbi:lactoylglutathione lyase [Pochonia chlamydosporia 170]|uniref:Lactoylglutathione lyase n=1 Tax=Pochonia chlamydosporia 170 TaxID=1380566 RepID=A0A179FW16_METCM|nr:lactoylglutathione lyase [Pochonia chlamydosporia 170]OAQ69189.1 lactoylglutathione lyase [Pochonia chlamydosporia 170]
MATVSEIDFSQWKMNHTMIRVKDPKKSIAFYEKLGLCLVDTLPQPEGKFDLYFLGFDGEEALSAQGTLRSDRQGLLELTHNYGTEHDDSYTVANGNEEPYLGLQHLGITVESLEDVDVVEGLADHTIEYTVRRHAEQSGQVGEGSCGQAICKDPDGYFVELNQRPGKTTGTKIKRNLFNFTGLRVKDGRVSLPWYSNVLGMKLLHQTDTEGITAYWLGYPQMPDSLISESEGLVQLIWVHGSESKEGRVYHNGNNQPQGFGHIGEFGGYSSVVLVFDSMLAVGANIGIDVAVAVDDIMAACQHFESQRVSWKKRLTDGRLKSIAFILDPDEYWIEIIQNARIKEPLGVQ